MTTTNDLINIVGYDIVASAVCDYGAVLVLNNNSTHYIVVETETGGEDLSRCDSGPDYGKGVHTVLYNPTARVVRSFEYDATRGSTTKALTAALALMAAHAVAHSESLDEPTDACPSCGSRPGDGVTKGCADPNGCGYWNEEA